MIRRLRRIGKQLVPRRYHHAIERTFGEIRALGYPGRRVICPWCGSSFRAFATYRIAGKAAGDSFCPRCKTFTRHRLLWFFLQKRADLLPPGGRVLHFAPEYELVRFLRHNYPIGLYVTVDLDAPLARIRADITHLPWQEGSFDLILCNHVLEHIDDDQAAMLELWRVLAPGGKMIVTVPMSGRMETFEQPGIVDPRERERLFGQHDHLRLYGADIVGRLEQAGFQVTVEIPGRDLDEATIQRFGISRLEVIMLCRRMPLALP